MAARALVETLTGTPDDGRLAAGAVAIAVLLFPAIGGLAARGRNGLARLLLIVALCFAYIDSYAPLTVPFSPAIWRCRSRSPICRAPRGNWAGARPRSSCCRRSSPRSRRPSSAWIFHARLASLPAPYPSLSVAADVFTHDKLRLITGHGFATVSRGVHDGSCRRRPRGRSPSRSGMSLASSAPCWRRPGRGSRSATSSRAPARLAPYMAAAFSAVVALAFLNVDFVEMTTLTLIAVAILSTDVAARSQYRTTRPSAAQAGQSLRRERAASSRLSACWRTTSVRGPCADACTRPRPRACGPRPGSPGRGSSPPAWPPAL